MNTTEYGPTTLERGSRRTARGRRFLRGRKDDDRTRWSNRHLGVFDITDDGLGGKLKRKTYRRYYCMLDQLSDILGTGLSERISMLRRGPEVSSAPDEVQVAEIRDRRGLQR